MYFRAKEKNAVTFPQRKNAFWGMSKTKKLPSRNTIALEQLHQRLGHRSTISLLDGDTSNVWEDIELKIDLDTSCQISSMKKKARSNNTLKPKSPFKWGFMDTILTTAPKHLTSDTTFSNYLLIVDTYSKIPKLYGIEKISA